MNPTNNSYSPNNSGLQPASTDANFCKVFNKYSTFSGWAESSSEKDLYEGVEVEIFSESEMKGISEDQSHDEVKRNDSSVHKTCNSDIASEKEESSNEDTN